LVVIGAEVANGRNGKSPISQPIANGIAIVITVVWAASFIADIFIKDYDPSPFVHFIMLGVAGAIFGHSFFKSGEREADGNGKS
jgi:uncharacterized membrane protein YeaQ/YmgE (transglycosylase-associated protein family)